LNLRYQAVFLLTQRYKSDLRLVFGNTGKSMISWKSSQLDISSLLFLRQEMQIMKQYTQLTCELRYQLYALNKSGMSQTKIALQLGVDQSSISRELKRNKGLRSYRPKQANEKADFRKKDRVKARVMTTEMIEKIKALLKELWSPFRA
jgi:DNA-binding MarR family transcriptional regulator